jgi:hypothetical protein
MDGVHTSRSRNTARRLLNLLTALSLLLLVATTSLWVRSYVLSDKAAWRRPHGVYSARTARGHLVVEMWRANGALRPGERYGFVYERDDVYPAALDAIPRLYVYPDPSVSESKWHGAGFGWYTRRRVDGAKSAAASAPFWALAAAAAALPLGRAVPWLIRARRRRKRAGLCPTCGYDLRATPDRCPECGRGAVDVAGNASVH